MEHIKEHHMRSIFKSGHRITIEGPVQAEEITRLAFHPDLDAFGAQRSNRKLWPRSQHCLKGELSLHTKMKPLLAM